MTPRRVDTAACGLTFLLAANSPSDTATVKLVSNREIFDVSLEKTAGSVAAVQGRTVLEFRVACGGYRTSQRSIADVVNSQGDIVHTDFITRFWESRDGHSMHFEVLNRQDGRTTDNEKGSARLDSDGTGKVTFVHEGQPFILPRDTVFPTTETLEILSTAARGPSNIARNVFQGGGQDAVYFSTATIGPALATRSAGEDARDPGHLLRNVRAWPVLIGFFSPKADVPESEVAMHLFANGLLGSLSLVYPEYTLRAHLRRAERLPSSC